MRQAVTVEICVGDVESAVAAESGGADRVELCDNLALGGTTPSAGMVAEACRRLAIPVHVLIRPRAGDFVYGEAELAVMRHDIEAAKSLGAAGVVLGILTPDAMIDRAETAAFVALARPLSVTFHKAFDVTSDLPAALDTLIALGVERVLTSGGPGSAIEGIETLVSLVERARGRIAVMAGGRLAMDNLETIIRQAKVREVHLGSAVRRSTNPPIAATPHDSAADSWNSVDPARVAAVVKLARGL
jgi:copper homeostasis protein